MGSAWRRGRLRWRVRFGPMGYQTAAFLGSFVLDRRFGLDQGFDTYDSPAVALNSDSSDPGDIKRKGEAVADAGEAWLGTHADRPFFLFLHLYDLHTPYNLSAAEEAKYGKGYNGELSYHRPRDWRVLGLPRCAWPGESIAHRLYLGSWRGTGRPRRDHAWVFHLSKHAACAADYPLASRVQPPMAERVDTPASLLDLSPTILDAVRLPVPQAMEGTACSARAVPPRDVFSESLYPQRHFGSSALTSLRSGHYKYIEAPRPEFYDLAQDPGRV